MCLWKWIGYNWISNLPRKKWDFYIWYLSAIFKPTNEDLDISYKPPPFQISLLPLSFLSTSSIFLSDIKSNPSILKCKPFFVKLDSLWVDWDGKVLQDFLSEGGHCPRVQTLEVNQEEELEGSKRFVRRWHEVKLEKIHVSNVLVLLVKNEKGNKTFLARGGFGKE